MNFINGVKEFIDFASAQHDTMDGELIRCPCVKCGNLKFFEPDEVAYHLVRKGFTENYFNWTLHGEEQWVQEQNFVNENDTNSSNQWFFDDTVPTFVPHWGMDGVRYEHTSIDNDVSV